MSIPKIRQPGSITSGTGWEGNIVSNGKGDRERNVSPKFKKRLEEIFGPRKPLGGRHLRISYRNGKRIELVMS